MNEDKNRKIVREINETKSWFGERWLVKLTTFHQTEKEKKKEGHSQYQEWNNDITTDFHKYWKGESLAKHLPTKETPASNGFSSKFYQTCEEVLISNPHKLVQKIKKDTKIPNLFSEATIIPILKPLKKTSKEKKNYKPISLINLHTNN